MVRFTRSAARTASDDVARDARDGRCSTALAEALAVLVRTLDFSHPIAPERHGLQVREPITPDAGRDAGDAK